ncbi:MAG: D-alanine--D-alanine ligase [Coriobacteriaceae bacterium]|nr:MAG: D-alanine--D-alanine ligase [Coriobacteriaceae bacterium]
MTRDVLFRLHIAILAGGWSDERNISMESGQHCLEALTEAGFKDLTLFNVADPDFVDRFSAGHFDFAFITMHGRYGEDGCIQGFLETIHIPYTFSGVLASALGNDKVAAKVMYRNAGIPVPRGETVDISAADDSETIDRLIEELSFPIFVKPSANGSSYGVTRVNKHEELPLAIKKAAAEGDRVLVEQCIEGTEITVPVIGTEDPQVLPIVEVVFDNADYYDVSVKSEPASLHHIIPARLTDEETRLASDYAIKAHKALGCRGTSRSDFIVTKEGIPYILETNMIPGMTKRSLLPDSAERAGIPFSELCTRFVEWGLKESVHEK